jgi:hypothetical protein
MKSIIILLFILTLTLSFKLDAESNENEREIQKFNLLQDSYELPYRNLPKRKVDIDELFRNRGMILILYFVLVLFTLIKLSNSFKYVFGRSVQIWNLFKRSRKKQQI